LFRERFKKTFIFVNFPYNCSFLISPEVHKLKLKKNTKPKQLNIAPNVCMV